MDCEKNFLIGNYVKGKRTFNGEVIEGKFNGFRLYNKLNPKSVVGVIDTDERCYDVSVDSIELVESEDKRIRKDIIAFIERNKRPIAPVPSDDTLDRWIAWLEKQGEQKPADNVNALMSLDEAIEHCKEKSCGNNACALEHKQLEKWLTELKELKEQKSAEWCEDDENILNDIIVFTSGYADKRVVKEWVSFLKSLTPRQRQEWSKDTSASKEIIVPFSQPDRNDCYHGGPCTNPYHDCINCPRIFSGNGTTFSTDGTNLNK